MDAHEELVRLFALQLRRTAASQADVIRDMTKAGFAPKRVAELLGTTPNTVSQVLAETKRQVRKKDGRGGVQSKAVST